MSKRPEPGQTAADPAQREGVAGATPAEAETRPGILAFMLRMGLFVILGMPLVAFLWETIHQLLALHFNWLQLLLTIPAALLLFGLITWMHRSVQGWLGETG